MKIFCADLYFTLIPALALSLDQPSRFPTDPGDIIHGGNVHFNKVVVDTHCLMGSWCSGADHNGQFQTPGGAPAWNGWTSVDRTAPTQPSHWHISDYYAANLHDNGAGNLAAWCGDPGLASCSAEDPAGGYGNSWDEMLQWTAQVADPGLPCLVTIDAWLNHDTEPAYDYCYVSLLRPDQDPLDIWVADGIRENLPLHLEFTCEPADYLASKPMKSPCKSVSPAMMPGLIGIAFTPRKGPSRLTTSA